MMQSSYARIKNKTVSHRSALKTTQTSQNSLSRFTSQQSSRKTALLPPNYLCKCSVSIDNPWDFLQARRQSQLNSMFNIRKNKLDQITKDNYAIYERINTQATHYPKIINLNQNTIRTGNSKFYTIQQSEAQDIQNRKILGPISNFKVLQKPVAPISQQIYTYQNMLKQRKSTKSTSLAKINPKKSKFKKNGEDSLPILFQFF